MVHFKDCENANGKTDYAARRRAEIAQGDRCTACDGYIVSIYRPKIPGPQQCSACRTFGTDDAEVDHSTHVRCPQCGSSLRVYDMECGELYEEGTNGVICPSCACEFTVDTAVDYTFTSPPRLPPEERGEPDED